MPKWTNMPTVDEVLQHETEHPRPDGIRLGDIMVDGMGRVECNDWSYGEWICHHYRSRLQPWVSVLRLKAIRGKVLTAMGFTAWCCLTSCRWARECRYFPVGPSGLPRNYII